MTRRYNVLRISQLLLFNYYLARKVSPNEIGEESDWANPLLRDVPRGLVDPTNRMVFVNLADDTRYYSFVYKDFFFRQLRAGLIAEYEEVSANGVHRLQYEQSPNVVEVGWRNLSLQSRVNGARNTPVTELSVEQLEYAKDCIAVTVLF